MKRRSWLWFIASAFLAIVAGVLAIVALRWAISQERPEAEAPTQSVVVARQPLPANATIRTENVAVEERQEFPSGVVVRVSDVVGATTRREIAQGEIIVMQDIIPTTSITGTLTSQLDDKIAVALPADDILSQWGAVLPGDHVDVLFTLDVILETPMYLEDILAMAEGVNRVERDQSMDSVSVLALQNLEVLRIIEEPQPEFEETQQPEGLPVELPDRALVLKIDPQDALVLKYLRDSVSRIDVALRSPTNSALFQVQPVNINYLVLRYGMVLPQPLE